MWYNTLLKGQRKVPTKECNKIRQKKEDANKNDDGSSSVNVLSQFEFSKGTKCKNDGYKKWNYPKKETY